MLFKIVESNRGGKIAVHGSHSYNQKQTTMNCIHWRCTKDYKLKCPATLKTEKMKLSFKRKVLIMTTVTPANVKRKKWIKLKEKSNFQHQLWQLLTKYPNFPMISQFKFQCPRKTTCCEQFWKTTKDVSSNTCPN